MRQSFVTASDGVRLALYEGGNPDGPEILFIHGFSQCARCWQGQFDGDVLASTFRLTAFDVRGHGASDKPVAPEFYREDRIFAEDVRAAMQALGLKRPVLVGWSYAGRLIGDYLAAFGTGGIAGINYVCARTSNPPEFNGPGTAFIAAMIRDDAEVAAAATKNFIRACFAKPLSEEDFARVLEYNMLVPPLVRAYHIRRPPSTGAVLRTIDVPVLVSQGCEDQLVLRSQGEWTAQVVPGATLSLYEGVGHSPFVEDAARFNRELAEFGIRVSTPRAQI